VERLRRLSFAIEPTPLLDALGLVVAAGPSPSGRVGLVDDRLVRAVTRSLSAHAPVLAMFERWCRWLVSHEQVQVTPLPTPRRARGPMWRVRVEGRVDLKSLGPALEAAGGRVDSAPHTTLYALRALLREAATGPLWSIVGLSSGKQALTPAEALRALEGLARGAGLGEGVVPRRFDAARGERAGGGRRTPEPEAAAEEPVVPEVPKARKTTKAPKVAEASKVAEAKVAEAPAPKVSRPRVRKAPPTTQGGFGGLPDDATSEAPPLPQVEPKSARGLGLDAEYFLEVAAVASWPCARGVLRDARRRVIARLHPDHAGDDAGRDFHRALKGFTELLALSLADDAAPASAAVSATAVTPVPSTPKPSVPAPVVSAPRVYNEWPPPAPPVPAPVSVSEPVVAAVAGRGRRATRSR